jgi:hypothetical protein
MRRPVLLLWAALLCATAAVGVNRLLWPTRSAAVADRSKAKPEQLLVVPEGHDSFGEVWESKDFTWSFPVMNRGDRPVTVASVTGSCNCLSVSPEKFTIEPGQTRVITARIDFTVKPRKDENAALALDYLTSDEAGQLKPGGQWVLSGKARPLVMPAAPLDFGRQSVLAQPLKPLSVEARFGAKLDYAMAESLIPGVGAEVIPGPDDRYRLVLTPTAEFPVGRVEGAILLKIKPDSEAERTEQIPVAGLIVPDVEASPPAYPGGGRLVGEWFEFDVAVSSISQNPFTVVGVKAVGDGLSVTAKDGRYVVRQDCLAEGEQSGRVEFEVEGTDGRYTVSVAVDYTGFRD